MFKIVLYCICCDCGITYTKILHLTNVCAHTNTITGTNAHKATRIINILDIPRKLAKFYKKTCAPNAQNGSNAGYGVNPKS